MQCTFRVTTLVVLFKMANVLQLTDPACFAALSSACSARLRPGNCLVSISSRCVAVDGLVAHAQIGSDGAAGGHQIEDLAAELFWKRMGAATAPSTDVVTKSQANQLCATRGKSLGLLADRARSGVVGCCGGVV